MIRVTQFLGAHFNHVCALLIVVTLLGVWRVQRAVRLSIWSQVFLLAWLGMLLFGTYLVPPLGIWAVGVVIPLFADNHLYAWYAERLGAESVLGNIRQGIRAAGPAAYVAAASTQHLLHGALGLVIITVSGSRNSWGYWLGYGVLASAGLGILAQVLIVRHLRTDPGAAAREAA